MIYWKVIELLQWNSLLGAEVVEEDRENGWRADTGREETVDTCNRIHEIPCCHLKSESRARSHKPRNIQRSQPFNTDGRFNSSVIDPREKIDELQLIFKVVPT